jgi:hypothetical protein
MRPVYSTDRRCAASAFNVPCPLHWQAVTRPSRRRRACPFHWQTERSCYRVHCAHHHSYVAREASAACQCYTDRGYQGHKEIALATSITGSKYYIRYVPGPHVGAQHSCTCFPLAIKGRHTTLQAQTHLGPAQAHKFIQALKLNTSHTGVGCYTPAARTTLNPCVFLCSFIA